jgi:FlaG/FlaF family flagellin (archaellin)
LSPSGLFFPLQIVGTRSRSQVVFLTNTGTSSLAITSVTASGDFQQTNNCGSSLGGGVTCTINVTFTPSVIGSRSGTITVTDNASNSPQRMSLKGTGTIASLSPTGLSYGIINVGSRSTAKVTALTNNGTVPLNLFAITITGTDPSDFTRTTSCTASLSPGQSCTISVIFAPTASGRRTATLNVSDDGGGSPQTVSLVGTGR